MTGKRARPKRRANTRFRLVAALLLLLVAAAVFHDRWWALWLEWWRGPLTDSAHLLTIPVWAWGRIAKCLQLVAGLSVILDLLGPETLREWGKKRTEQQRAAKNRVAELRTAARLVDDLRTLAERVRSDLRSELHKTPRECGTAEYEALLVAVRDALGGEIMCASCRPTYVPPTTGATIVRLDRPAYKWECNHGKEVIGSLVDASFFSSLTDSERAAWRTTEETDRWIGPTTVLLLGIAVIGMLSSVLFTRQTPLTMALVMPPVIVSMIAAFVLTMAWVANGDDRLVDGRRLAGAIVAQCWSIVRYAPVPLIRWIAGMMDRPRPAYPLRWAAVWLFISGSLLDLLAS
ncbi:hypothetical protein [Nocardia africana]|uniref:Uncharacterized protein n=1 Tax=Nocardia africana TaxID=134964 RepID=A0ABW6NTW8_9NOCA